LKSYSICVAIALIATITLTQLSCALFGYSPLIDFFNPGYQSHSHESLNFEQEQRFNEHNFAVHTLMRSVNIQIILKINEGSASYKLVDPKDEIRWQGKLSSGEKFNQSRGFGAISGEWKFLIDLLDATGSYDVYWYGE
jgi:hypothetical protein